MSDDNGIDFEDVGFFELKLTDIYEHGDYIDRRVGVLDKNGVCRIASRCPSLRKRRCGDYHVDGGQIDLFSETCCLPNSLVQT